MRAPPNPAAMTVSNGREGDTDAPPRLRNLIRKSALLNLAVVLTAFPVLAAAGGPLAVLPALVVMAAISTIIWIATFAAFSFVSTTRLFRGPGARRKRRAPRPTTGVGVEDEWLD